jgi:hypothetical protein
MAPTGRLPSNISFVQIDPSERLADKVKANVVFSWSCFEHIERRHLLTIFKDIYDLLPTGGLFFLQIEPLYFSPYGSHLRAYLEQPWQHLLISEEELRQRVQDANPPNQLQGTRNSAVPLQQKKSFHLRQYGTLNKLTADELVEIGRSIGFTVQREMRSRIDIEPPAELIARHGIDNLLTNETRVLFKKMDFSSKGSIAQRAKRMIKKIVRNLGK